MTGKGRQGRDVAGWDTLAGAFAFLPPARPLPTTSSQVLTPDP